MIEFNVRHIDNAIQKSRARENYTIYRGVRNISRIENPSAGGAFTEKAFGSFTLSFDKALGYTKLENLMIFQLELLQGENILFMGQNEEEMLRPRESAYKITKIRDFFVEKFNMSVKIYYIESQMR